MSRGRLPAGALVRCAALLAVLFQALGPAAAAAPAPVVELFIDGAIGPATADYLHRGLERAAKEGAQLVILRIDTPGGLDTSMRAIIKDILASRVPVASFVAPGGARAASAGTYILYASHIAAMAPGTNLGAATPVAVGSPSGAPSDRPGEGGNGADKAKSPKDGQKAGRDAKEPPPLAGDAMTRKQVHDAAAYIRGLAELRGRNADWAERAVREAVSLPANEALKMKVIDVLAPDVPELLRRIDGRSVEVPGRRYALETADAPVTQVQPDWRTRVLSVITDPSVAYLLILVGIYALIFEFSNPGLVLPGVAGAICILVALYAFHLLPVNYAGLALVLLGIAFMVAELFFPAYGSLGAGGAIAFITGSIMLIDTDIPEYSAPPGLVFGVTAVSALFLFVVVGMALRAHRRPVVSGREELLGSTGEVLEDFQGEGWARVHGETWRVRSSAPLRAGERVRVAAMDGLTLDVVADTRGETT